MGSFPKLPTAIAETVIWIEDPCTICRTMGWIFKRNCGACATRYTFRVSDTSPACAVTVILLVEGGIEASGTNVR